MSTPTSRILRVLVVATAVSTAVGLWYALAQRAAFEGAFPGAAEGRVYAGLLATGVVGLVALAGLWMWQRWAVLLYGLGVVSSLVLDVAAEAPVLHQLTVLVGAVAIYSLIFLNRSRFGWTGGASLPGEVR